MKEVMKMIGSQNSKIHKTLDYLHSYGIRNLLMRIIKNDFSLTNNRSYDFANETKLELEAHRKTTFSSQFTFSILTPLYNTPEIYLKEMIESVINQTYPNWELCLCDASDSSHSYVQTIVEDYQKKDNRIKYKKFASNGGISANTNECINIASGDYLAMLDHDDVLHPLALHYMQTTFKNSNALVAYTDEAKFTTDIHKAFDPNFKPDFSVEDLRTINYICHFLCFKKEIVNKIGLFNSQYDGSQDHDFILRISEYTKNIVHIRKVLYFWRCHSASVAKNSSAKSYASNAGISAVTSHLQRQKIGATVFTSPSFQTIYHVKYNLRCVPSIHIILYGTSNKNKLQKAKDILLSMDNCENAKISYVDKLVCAKTNDLISSINEDYIFIVHASIEDVSKDTINETLMLAQNKNTIAVGPAMLSRNNVFFGCGVTDTTLSSTRQVKWHRNMPLVYHGYQACLKHVRSTTSLDEGFVVLNTSLLKQVGNFDLSMGSFMIDDYLLRAKQLGFYTYWTPFATIKFSTYKTSFSKNKKGLENFKSKWDSYISKGDSNYNENLWKYGIMR